MKPNSLILLISAFILMSSDVFAADGNPLNRPDDPPPPPTYTPSYKSSGGVAPVANTTTYYSSQSTDTTPVLNFNAAALPKCPLDPNAYTQTEVNALSTTLTSSPYYPDIGSVSNPSGTMPGAPGGSTSADSTQYTTTGTGSNLRYATPPDQCTVTSRVICADSPTPADTCRTSKVITQAVAAVCPDGYVQVGSYDMQAEVVYNSVADTKNSPGQIANMTDYQYYKDLGYQCSVPAYNTILYSPCSASGAGGSINYTYGYARGVAYPNPGAGPGVVMFGGISYYDKWAGGNNTCYTGNASCSGIPDAACVLANNSGSPTYGGSSSSISVYLSGGFISFSTQFGFTYGNISCTLPVGMYFTNKSAPRSLICARIKSQYDKMNK